MIKNLIGTHMFPGDIKITVEEIDEQNCKIDIDHGNVDFHTTKLPEGFDTFNIYREFNGKYYNVPIMHYSSYRTGNWYIRLNCMEFCGDWVKFPYVCTRTWASDFIIGFGLVIDALVKDKYIPIELMDDKKVKELLEAKVLLSSEIAKYNWQIRRAYILQNEDANHYVNIAGTCPLCETYTCSKCPLDNIGDNCNDVGSTWRRCRNAPDRIKLVEACEAMIDQLDDTIVKEREIKQKSENKSKQIIKELFDGSKISAFPYLYSGRVMDHSSDWGNINEFSCKLGIWSDKWNSTSIVIATQNCVQIPELYLPKSIECEGRNIKSPTITYQEAQKILQNWRTDNMKEELFNGMPENVESIKYKFGKCNVKIDKNGTAFKVQTSFDTSDGCGERYYYDINTLNNYICEMKREYVTPKTTLMTREEMLELLNEGKLLPAEICKQKYERLRQYCIENKIINRLDIRVKGHTGVSTCALCEINDGCEKCSLKCVGEKCTHYSAYDRMVAYDEDDHDEFIKLIDNMIEALDRAISYEKKITHIYTRDEMIEIYNEGKLTPVELSLEIWRQKENYVRLHRNVKSFDDISNQNPDSVENCPLCYHYRCRIGNTCKGCVLDKMDDNCTKADTTFNKVADYRGKNHDEFLKLVHNMVIKLEEAVEFEKAEKSKNDLVDIPNYFHIFEFSDDVKVTTIPNGNGFRLFICSASDRDFVKQIQFKNKLISMHMWKDISHKYNWYVHYNFINNYMPEIDKCKFDEGCFNNGIELSREGTQILITAIKLMCEAE